MTKKSDLVWAVDRETREAGRYTEGFLNAWPSGYLRLASPPKSKPRASAPVSVPEGTDMERSE